MKISALRQEESSTEERTRRRHSGSMRDGHSRCEQSRVLRMLEMMSSDCIGWKPRKAGGVTKKRFSRGFREVRGLLQTIDVLQMLYSEGGTANASAEPARAYSRWINAYLSISQRYTLGWYVASVPRPLRYVHTRPACLLRDCESDGQWSGYDM